MQQDMDADQSVEKFPFLTLHSKHDTALYKILS